MRARSGHRQSDSNLGSLWIGKGESTGSVCYTLDRRHPFPPRWEAHNMYFAERYRKSQTGRFLWWV
jgi:hypothetical protein